MKSFGGGLLSSQSFLASLRSSRPFAILISAALGLVVYCSVYGVLVLNPTYDAWLLEGGDLTMHYIGWRGYRVAPWTLPIGDTDFLSYPAEISTVWSDTIPLFAVFFKLLSPVLPMRFQYFGWWGAFCFMFSAAITAYILSSRIKNAFVVVVLSSLLLFVPAVYQRMFLHTALDSHWLIILALATLFCYRREPFSKGPLLNWFLLGCLAVWIHSYYIGILATVLLGYLVMDLAICKKPWRELCISVAYGLGVLISLWVLGALGSGLNASGWGLGRYSMNLNTFYNPMDRTWSTILQPKPYSTPGQYEGFAYLGAGGLLLLILALFAVFASGHMRKLIRENRVLLLSLLVTTLSALIIAASPTVGFNGSTLFSYELPESVTNLLAIFRSTGRFAWVPMYVMLITGSMLIGKYLTAQRAFIIGMICVALQSFDIRHALADVHSQYATPVTYSDAIESASEWKSLAEANLIRHLAFVTPLQRSQMYYPFTMWAFDNDITVNRSRFARGYDVETVERDVLSAIEEKDPSYLFIIAKDSDYDFRDKGLNLYDFDVYIVGSFTNLSPYGFKDYRTVPV